VFFFRFFRKKGKKKKQFYTKSYIFYAFRQSFAMKLGYYPTLGLDFQTASEYSAHPHFITNNEVITKLKHLMRTELLLATNNKRTQQLGGVVVTSLHLYLYETVFKK